MLGVGRVMHARHLGPVAEMGAGENVSAPSIAALTQVRYMRRASGSTSANTWPPPITIRPVWSVRASASSTERTVIWPANGASCRRVSTMLTRSGSARPIDSAVL